ncbi:MAG: c-type cytochrome, partial [Acidobacteriota bacterium]
KYADEWHFVHHWDARMLTPDSIMPRYPWLFDGPSGPIAIVPDKQGRPSLEQNEVTTKLFDFASSELIELTPNPDGLVFVREPGKYPVIVTPKQEFTGKQVTLLAPTEELRGLVAYIQKLGMNRGKWRDQFEPQLVSASNVELPRSQEYIDYGKNVFERRCMGCHGARGDGNGEAATFFAVRPRNFTSGTFKFRSTPSGSLPTDGDLLRTIVDGVRGTPMPTWHELAEKDRLAVMQYVKYALAIDNSDPKQPYAFFTEEQPAATIAIGKPPEPTPALLAKGRQLWTDVKCSQCHGDSGKGDGPSAVGLKDDWGFTIRPANLTTGLFKSGPSVKDIFRTISTGLNGTPMPSFVSTLPNEEDRWALAYFILSLSAFKDPLTGDPLPFTEQERQEIDAPTVKAETSDTAFRRHGEATPRHVWAEYHGIQELPVIEKAQAPSPPGGPS